MELDRPHFACPGALRAGKSPPPRHFRCSQGRRRPAQRTLDGIEDAYTLKGLGLDAGLASGPRARPAARTAPPWRAGIGVGETARFGSITLPPPRQLPLETALSRWPRVGQFTSAAWANSVPAPTIYGHEELTAHLRQSEVTNMSFQSPSLQVNYFLMASCFE